MSWKEFFAKMSAASGKPHGLRLMPGPDEVRDADVIATKIDGDEARLTIARGGNRRTMDLVREDGRWYFELLSDD
jgi:hypothetical protein